MRQARSIFKKYISQQKLKFTAQRQAVLDTFLRSNMHISVEELYRRIRSQNSRIGLSTVYRTMRLLAECGLAIEQHFGDGETRYESVRKHHDHMICTQCGRIIEFFEPAIERLQNKVADREKFKLVDHKMELYGICSTCRSRRNNDSVRSSDRR